MSTSKNFEVCLIETIHRMVELLSLAKQPYWAKKLDHILGLPFHDGSMTREILSLYGGMGSLNDLVLYLEGKVDVKINNEFDSLRTTAYELCYSSRPYQKCL